MKPKRKKRTFVRDEEGLRLLAESIRETRKQKGFTQEDLSHESELTLSQIARVETFKINPTVSTIFRIARALNVPVSQLFDFTLKRQSK